MRLCAWFWHHQLARGTHTPPVRGKHPACSRNCQAGLTAGTPCSALRGLSENPFLAVTLTVLILLGLSTWPVELFLPFLERTYRCRSPGSRASTRNPLLPLLLRDSSPNAWHSPGLLPPRSQSLPEPPNHRTPHPRVSIPGRTQSPAACGSAREPGDPAGRALRAGETRRGLGGREGDSPTYPTEPAGCGAGVRGALRGPGSGALRSIALLLAARARAWRRRVTAGVGEAGGSGRERAGPEPASTHGCRGRTRLPRALPPAGRSPPEGARRDEGHRSPPQLQPAASWRRRGGAQRPGLRRRRSGLGAGRSPRPQCLASGCPPRTN